VKARAWSLIGATAVSALLLTGMTTITASASTAGASATAAPAAAAAATAALQPWPTLSQGRNRAWPPVTVRSLQYLLNARGAKLTVDGQFGAKTKAAVIAFQKAKGLKATGVVTSPTWLKLIVTVRQGSTGSAVRAVQDQVNFRNNRNGHTLNVDGIFGAKTTAAVKAFQKGMATEIRGFPVDGIVGPQTWQALVTEALSF
jgi:peptidoglycan hydrolase-like protein with peptidoglycan-binding domain